MALSELLVIEVLDFKSRVIPGEKVEFVVVAGGGSLTRDIKADPKGKTSVTIYTDARGRAAVTLILGMIREVSLVEARVWNVAPVTFTATVGNSPPKLSPIGNKSVDEASVLRFTVSATDPDPEDKMTLSASPLPANANFTLNQPAAGSTQPLTGVFNFTPDYTQSGVYRVTFSASDGSLTASEAITITVRNVNRPPVLSPIGNRTVNENTELIINISATDPDGDALSFSASGMPSGAVLQQQNAQCVFRWTPGYDIVKSGDALDFPITFTVNDASGGSDSERVVITVRNVEPPPVPDIRVSANSIDFGTVGIGESADRVFQVFNDGKALLRILSITSTDQQFSVLSYSDVNPGDSVSITARFTPSSPGLKLGQLVISSNDPDEPSVPIAVQGRSSQTPDIRVPVSSIDFGEVVVGQPPVQPGVDKIMSIFNDGDTVLQIHDIISNNTQFTVSGYSNVEPHGEIKVTVRFTPSSPGPKTGKLSIVSNDPDEPVVPVSLQGVGIPAPAPDIRVLPSSIDFGEVEVGKFLDKEFRIYNDGNAGLQIPSITSSSDQFILPIFILGGPDVTAIGVLYVEPGGMVAVSIRFKPSSTGAKTGIITIVSNDPDEPSKTVSVQGKGVIIPVPDIRVSPSSINFGEVEVGRSLDKEFRIYNDGGARLLITSITSNSSQFVVLDDPDVEPGGVAVIPVRFIPSSAGTKIGVITVASNDPDEPSKTVSVQGKGVIIPVPDIRVSPSSINFGEVRLGESLDRKFRIYNDGGALLRILSIASNNSRFVVLNYSDVSPGGVVEVSVRFTPSVLGTENGTITIVSNDMDESSMLISVEGKGIAGGIPNIYVSPRSIDFGKVELGSSSTRSFYIYNLGAGLLRISSLTSNNSQFEVLDDPDVAPGDIAEIPIRFRPSSLGLKNGVITITSNDPDEPNVSVSLYGEGTQPGGPVAGGWQIIRQQNLQMDLYDVYFIDEYNGWLVGANGTVAHSSNGGNTWTLQRGSASGSLKGVYFADSSNGWAVGQYGAILRTTNGGYSWSSQDSSVSHDLNAVRFITPGRGWIVGNAGTILTTSTGYSWSYQSSGTQFNLNDVCFVDTTQGWAVGNYGTILRTDNGGQTWTKQTSGTDAVLHGVDFIDYYEGWAVGSYGTILYTRDGGRTWTSRSSSVTYDTLMDVDFISFTEGWIVGYSGMILYTRDGGSTWTRVNSGVNEPLRAVQFRDADSGWAVGSYGMILKYSTEDPSGPPVITSVSVYGSPARAGNAVRIVATGRANNDARFSITGVIMNAGMTENPPGTYTGIYTVAEGVNVTNATVTVTLTNRYGQVATDTSKTVTIDTVATIHWANVSPRVAKAGDIVTVNMNGESGGTSKFSIETIVEDVAMAEAAGTPGSYTGYYTVLQGTNADNARVTVKLTDRLGNVTSREAGQITIDTIAKITAASVTGSPAKFGDPITVVMVGESGGNAKFSISDIGSVAMVENQPEVYTGSYVAPKGMHVKDGTVTVQLTDKVGNTGSKVAGKVTIDTESRIESVIVTGSPARAGEIISVVMVGEPGGDAAFSIAGIVDKVPMTRDANQPGMYKSAYTVPENVSVTNAVVTVMLKDPVGNIGSDASKKVTIYPPWDVNRDGAIDVADLMIIGTYFGKAVIGKNDADVNGDGYVNVLDLILVCKHFGSSTTAASPGKGTTPFYSPFVKGEGKVDPEQLMVLRKLYDSIQSGEGEAPAEPPDLMNAKKLLAGLIGLTAAPITESHLMQNYPNPCNPETWIPYALAEPGNVTISIYSSFGQLIRTLDLGHKQVGFYSDRDKAAHWDGTNESGERVSSGIYFYVIRSGNFKAVRKLIVGM